MAENPYQKLLDQMIELLHEAEGAINKPLPNRPLRPEIHEQVQNLELMVRQFQEANDEMIAALGYTPEQVDALVKTPPSDIPKADAELIQRAKQVSREAKMTLNNATFGMSYAKKVKSAPAKRQKKFDRIGGRKKWKPL